MTAIAKLLDLIPTWLLAAAIALLGVMWGAEAMRLAHARELTSEAVAKVARTEAELADYKATVAETTRILQADNDRKRIAQLVQQKEAADAAKIRENGLRADADGARLQLDRLRVALRKAIAARGDPVPGAPADANDQPAATVGQLFLECAAAYADMAAKAGGHASDVQTLTESWPKP